MKSISTIARAGTVLLALASMMYCHRVNASDSPQPGSQYKIVGPVYLQGAYTYLNDRRVSRETAPAYVVSGRIAKRVWKAFECQIPMGTTMTILGQPTKVLHLP